MKRNSRAVADRESPLHKKRRGKHRKKVYLVERRFAGIIPTWAPPFLRTYWNKEWHVCGAYETERGRDDAFRTMSTKGSSFGDKWEYRIVTNEYSPS